MLDASKPKLNTSRSAHDLINNSEISNDLVAFQEDEDKNELYGSKAGERP
jgi:hypothetical protein